jgi:thiamine monophosphate synthase
MLLYRDKSNPNYAKFAKIFVERARSYNFERVLIQNDINLALELGADIHFSSDNFSKIPEAKEQNLFTVASCHTETEVNLAQELGVDMVTLSPLFPSPNKGATIPKQLFESICRNSKVPVIALGGIISQREIDEAILLGAKGIASIRYFK